MSAHGRDQSLDRFAALDARMSRAAPGAVHVESIATSFSASREASNPGGPDTTSGSPHPKNNGSMHGASPRQASSSSTTEANWHIADAMAGKRKRPPTPNSAMADGGGFGGALHMHSAPSLHTPSPHTAIGFGGVGVDSGAATHSAGSLFGVMPTSAAAAEAERLQQQQQQRLQELERELARVQQEADEKAAAADKAAAAVEAEREASAGLRSELELSKVEVEAAHAQIAGMRGEIEEIRGEQEQEAQRQTRGREALRSALRERCFRARAETKERLARESIRLGTLEPDGKAFGGAVGWVQRDGTALIQLQERERQLEARRAALEEEKKALRKKKGGAAGGKAAAAAAAADGSGAAAMVAGEGGAAEEAAASAAIELADREEAMSFRASLLAKERAELAAERKQIEREAHEHYHELRLMHELESLEPGWLRDCPSLPTEGAVYEPAAPSTGNDAAKSLQRFVFLELIAQGGFSCVFKAYDLQRQQYAACKIHRMTDGWADARKEAFVRHVEREMEITVGVRHHRIVETFAAFEVSQSTVVSVMTYCNGGSLADLLRKQGALSERDAKSVMLQLLCGLRHLHLRHEPIIHYDLKPANILFHDGEVKLSDFGLSKVMAPPGASSSSTSTTGASSGSGATDGKSHAGIELTSYGSGTHGYLPPECYDGDQSRIDPKVDVFSAGVVHFVMLFHPAKPFFKQQTQQQIMQMKSHAIRQEASTLDFPGKLSGECQAFLRRALAPGARERPDVVELLADPYMTPPPKAAK